MSEFLQKRGLSRIALVYIGAVASGYVLSLLHVPLPWMIGPMIAAGLLNLIGRNVAVPGITRAVGQTIVAASVGLFFTPAAVAAASEQIVAMLAAALLTVLAGFLAAAVLMWLTRIDVVSASLACIPGGPVEMAALATRHGVAPGPVAFAQILRISLLVLTVPPLLVALDDRTVIPVFSGGNEDYCGATLLLLAAACVGIFMRRLRMTSPFFLGPLGVSALAAAMMLPVAAPPYWVLASARVLLGVWLGCMFDKQLLARSGGLVLAVVLSTGVLLVLCALMAFGISAVTGIEWRTMVLATAPGSVTEMALTANILQQGVALVTAFHVVRIFIILPSAPLIFAITARLAHRWRKSGKISPD